MEVAHEKVYKHQDSNRRLCLLAHPTYPEECVHAPHRANLNATYFFQSLLQMFWPKKRKQAPECHTLWLTRGKR